MACFRPLVAHRDRLTGETVVGYRLAGKGDRLQLPCGRCVGCQLGRAREWSIRIGHEASLYDANVFLTLDYAPAHLRSLSLQYEDFQRFMKRLRKSVTGVSVAPNGRRAVRFFCAGEYGAQRGRPHWHAIVFNVWFPDSVRLANGTWRSSQAESLWGLGQVVIGDVTPASASYVAGYTMAKAHKRAEEYEEDLVDPRTGELSGRRPELVTMSRRPGIGSWWYDQFSSDLWSGDSAVQEGAEHKVPRYYFKRLVEEDPGAAEEIAYERYLRALDYDPAEGSEARLAVREEVALSRQEFFHQRRL